MALAVGAVHEHLLATGVRMAKDIVGIAGDAVDVHDIACLITVGATAVHPYLALATAAQFPEGEIRYRKALEAGPLELVAASGHPSRLGTRLPAQLHAPRLVAT